MFARAIRSMHRWPASVLLAALLPFVAPSVAPASQLAPAALASQPTPATLASQPALAVRAPVQSPSDDRQYRYLRLDNQLQVLLISDPDAVKAAAALDVYVGSAANPQDRGGLAHFLEHMLFLGTDKYPDAGEYARYISEHGGDRNAYTAFEHTNYFFDVDAEHLAGALDRFGQFFIAPRFDKQYVEREVNAVEAEYQLGLKSDPRRMLDVLREIVDPAHPYSILGVGTLETLADRPGKKVRDALLEFYREYYSANLMSLAVTGRESLDELQAMVEPIFSQVPEHGTRIGDIEAPLFAPGDLPLLVHIRPQATQRQLDLSFPLPDYNERRHYRAKPLHYLSNLIGHEGEGSLLSLLKEEGWAEGLSAGPGIAYRGGAAFAVSISLTEAGLAEREKVLHSFFQYVELLRRAGPQQAAYEEQARLSDLAFRFQPEAQAIRYVSRLANDMHRYAPADILQGGYLMEDFDAELIGGILERYITAENVAVIVIAEDLPVDRASAFYDVAYSVCSLGAGDESTDAATSAPPVHRHSRASGNPEKPEKVENPSDDARHSRGSPQAQGNPENPAEGRIPACAGMMTEGADDAANWRHASSGKIDPRLHLPAPNEFIAENVALAKPPADNPPVPQLVKDDERLRLWFRQDDEFREPRGALYINFRNRNANNTAAAAAAARLYAALLQDAVNEFTYPAWLAGMSFSISAHARGISLKISGYDDKQVLLLARIAQSIAAAELDTHRFANIRDQLARDLENTETIPAFRQVMDDARVLLSGAWDERDLARELKRLKPAAVAKYAAAFWPAAEVDVMLNGNYAPEDADAALKALAPLLRFKGDAAPPVNEVAQLSPGDDLLFKTPVTGTEAVFFWYMQGRVDTDAERAFAALTGQIISSDFFDELRTRQQLGYVVSAFAWPLHQVPAVAFLVQSPTASLPAIRKAVASFLPGRLDPRVLSQEQFTRHRAALVSDILKPHRNLLEASDYFWRQIARRDLAFDSRDRLAAAVRAISYDAWRSWYQEVILDNPAALAIVAPGASNTLPPGTPIPNAPKFKQSRQAYERP